MAISTSGRYAFTWRQLTSVVREFAQARVWLKLGETFFPAPRIVVSHGFAFMPNILTDGPTMTVDEFVGQLATAVSNDRLDMPARATIWLGVIVAVQRGEDYAPRPPNVDNDDIVFEVANELPDL
jgi:hypothetical protein